MGTSETAVGPVTRPGSTVAQRALRGVSGNGDHSALIGLLTLVVGLVVLLPTASSYLGGVIVLAVSYGVVAIGMVIQVGFSQQIVFSQSVFMALGAYGVALLNADLGVPVLAGVVLMAIGAAAASLVIALLVKSSPGFALAVASLLFPLAVSAYVSFSGPLGGAIGLSLTGNLWPGSSGTVIGDAVLVVVALAAIVFLGERLLSSEVGLELYVMGANEGAAAAFGISPNRRKIELFVVGSVLASVGGSLYAGTQQFVPYSLIEATAELSLLIILFVGGRRSILGAVIGAILIQYLTGIDLFISVHILIIEAIAITVIILIEPEGLAGIVKRLEQKLPALLGRRRGGRPTSERPASVHSTHSPGPVVRELTSLSVGVDLNGSPDPARFAGAASTEKSGAGPILECRGVTKRFGGMVALDDVSFAIAPKGIIALCGPNGAGKTTLLDIVGGSTRCDRGEVVFAGEPLGSSRPEDRFRKGISRTFQAIHLVKSRSAVDNVAVACLSTKQKGLARGFGRNRIQQARELALEALEELDLGPFAWELVGSLTLETQRLVELARALASRPRLLILDEPASGLSLSERARLQDVLREVGTGVSVLLVEHDLQLVRAIAERVLVLEHGSLIFDGASSGFTSFSELSGSSAG